MSEKKKLNEVVLLRTFTILMVVLGHSCIVYVSGWGTFTPVVDSFFFETIKHYIDIFQMPLFIFISGFIYSYNKLERDKYSDKNLFIENKFKRLIIPYILVGVFYVIPIRLFIHYPSYTGRNIISILIKNLFFGIDIGHLWYLQVLFNIFVIFILFEKKINTYNWKTTFLILLFFNILSVITPDIFNVNLTFRYLLYFYLGYLVKKFDLSLKNNIQLTALFLIQNLAFLFNFYFHSANNFFILGIDFVVSTIASISACLFLYCLFKNINDENKELANNKIIKFIDNKSFGIYLFHSPILYLMLYFFIGYFKSPVLTVFILFCTMLIGSILITLIIEKVNILVQRNRSIL